MSVINYCVFCRINFVTNSKKLKICPICKNPMKIYKNNHRKKIIYEEEGIGRKYGAGGDACNYCPHCHGTEDWCPYID